MAAPAQRIRSSLTRREHKEAEERAAVTAATVHEAVRLEGQEELARPSSALAYSGVAAGLSMGFSLITEALLWTYLPDTPWRILISRLGYTVGFIIVVLGRQQLFTENTLTPVLPLLSERGWSNLGNLVRLWAIVLTANLLGAASVALVIGHTGTFPSPVRDALTVVSRQAVAGDPWTLLLRGIFAGWLIALMVWMLPFSESSRVTVVLIITYVVALGGFPHIIAGSVDVFYLLGAGLISESRAWLGWLLPTLVGNMLGGLALVAALNHAQVMSGRGN